MSKLIEKAAEKHKTWINIVNSFGCDKNISEDIVQEMYIYLIRYEKEGKNIWYENNEVNYWYIFKQLRGIYVSFLRVNSKITKVSLDEINKQFEEIDPMEYEEQYETFLNSYLRAVDDVYWYDKKVFELIAKGKSIAKLSRETKIGYYSLYNTYNKVKNKLKNELL
jgi:DNA-binding phage protein|tara:strand:- start:128 stop:625 length:498 start_codon:yes stop_codon:yes gene_type:complete